MSGFLGRQNRPGVEKVPPDRPETKGRPARDDGRQLLSGCARFVLIAFQLGIALSIVAAIFLVAGYLHLNNELSGAIEQVVRYQGQGPGGTPRFFDRHGRLLMELKTAEKRRWLDYQEIPLDVINATVAVEDDTFWSNRGFDPEAIIAALISNYRNPDQRPVGASTITQQLVRIIAFSYEERVTASYDRKLREVFLAFILTQKWSKQAILQMYLNEIYYGNLAYGIEAAAQTYFGKGAAELSLAETALLAGLPQSPAELDPYTNFEGAKARQELILDLMVDEGTLEPARALEAREKPLVLASLLPQESESGKGPLEAPHFVIYVQKYLEDRYGPDALVKGGWQVTTSLDLDLQKEAEAAARQWIAARAPAHDVNNAAVVVLNPRSGEILAMVGSLDYWNEAIDGSFNVAVDGLRQPGSSIKPITYAAAMERGWSTGDVIWDVPIQLDLGNGQTMRPVNYDGRYHGPLLLRDALANSYNIPPIQLIRDIGLPAFISTGRKMGIESLTENPGFYGLTLTLGGGEVTLLEMSQAFATLANMGQRPHLASVLQIVDGRGDLVFDQGSRRLPPVNALDPRIAYILTDILDDDAARIPAMGRGNALDLPFPAAVKTGTTNDFIDNWTLGYTPGVVVGVWTGNSDGHPMRNSSGLRGAAPLWRTIMESIHGNESYRADLAVRGVDPLEEFTMPPGIDERRVCLPRGTGGSSCTAFRTDLFLSNGPVHGVQRLGYLPDTTTNPGAWTLAIGNGPLVISEDGSESASYGLCVINAARPPSGASVRLYLPVPPYYPDEIVARRWAQQAGYSMAPSSVCSISRGGLSAGLGGAGGAPGEGVQVAINTVWRIESPTPGQPVSGAVPIVGTVQFDPAEIGYYKLEIGAGSSPTNWTTFGEIHTGQVSSSLLETLYTGALAPGNYVIRLIVVRQDGNFPTPHAVPIVVAGN